MMMMVTHEQQQQHNCNGMVSLPLRDAVDNIEAVRSCRRLFYISLASFSGTEIPIDRVHNVW